jgi:hypothetical protein
VPEASAPQRERGPEHKPLLLRLPAIIPRARAASDPPPPAMLAPAPAAPAATRSRDRSGVAAGGDAGAPGARATRQQSGMREATRTDQSCLEASSSSSRAEVAAAAPSQRLLRGLADFNAPGGSLVASRRGLRAGPPQPPQLSEQASAASEVGEEEEEQGSVTEEDSELSEEEEPAVAAAGTSAAVGACGAVSGGNGRASAQACAGGAAAGPSADVGTSGAVKAGNGRAGSAVNGGSGWADPPVLGDGSEGEAEMEFVSPWEIELSSVPSFSPPQLDADTAATLRATLDEFAKTAAAAPFRCRGPGSAHIAAPWGAPARAPSRGPRTVPPAGIEPPSGPSTGIAAPPVAPVGIELLLRRLHQGYYRQAAAVAQDAEWCGAAACVDPASAMLAHAVAPALKAAATGGAWRPLYDVALGGFRRSVVTAAGEAEDARRQARAAGAGEVAVAAAEGEEGAETEAQRRRAGKRRAVDPPSDASDGGGGSESGSDGAGGRRRQSRRAAGRAESANERGAAVAACGATQRRAPGVSEPSSRQQRAARRRNEDGVNGEEWQGWPAILPLEGGASGPAGPPTGFKIVLRVDREAGKATWVSRPGAARASTADESEEEEDRDQPAKRRRVR